jgi:hypothetical protein
MNAKTDTVAINQQINIREVAERAGATFHKNRSACPIHGGDNVNAFEIFDNGRAWTCHTREECNRHGHDGIALLRALNNWTFPQLLDQYQKPVDPQEAARRAVENAKRVEQELQRKIEEAQKALRELQDARKWLEYHNNMGTGARQLWQERGIPDDWQDFWQFGYTYSCPTYSASPSLTIPLFMPLEDEPRNIRHRLLSPPEPNDKYRPERSGLPAMPFYADPSLELDYANRIIIVEGEIKAAVTYMTVYTPGWQVIGMPGKKSFSTIAGDLSGHDNVWIIPDPDGSDLWRKAAQQIGGRIVIVPDKIDDLINAGKVDQATLMGMMEQARR